jgi:peptidoglycan/xylan/chitin deacetylase (PgdA/CDA1 family)
MSDDFDKHMGLNIFIIILIVIAFIQYIHKKSSSIITRKQAYEFLSAIRPGVSIVPKSWPNGKRCAVALSVDFDAESSLLFLNNKSLARHDLFHIGNRQGVPRLLKLFKNFNIPTTFFIPGIVVELYPELTKEIAKHGHEIGLHGWIHENVEDLTKMELLDLYTKSKDVIIKTTGFIPVGIRTPFAKFSEHIPEVAKELGLLYDSSLVSDHDCFIINRRGKSTNLLEIPISRIRDDSTYFNYNKQIVPPKDVLDIWKLEFLKAYEEGGVFQLLVHPHYMGYRSRIWIMEELCKYINTFKDVWFCTHKQLAIYVKSQAKRGL